eukprot:m.1001644 g.1001644  ORF g.1001644 m.1001644 type:complete len:69 (+) comp24032_c1_seq1:553-759(+)
MDYTGGTTDVQLQSKQSANILGVAFEARQQEGYLGEGQYIPFLQSPRTRKVNDSKNSLCCDAMCDFTE